MFNSRIYDVGRYEDEQYKDGVILRAIKINDQQTNNSPQLVEIMSDGQIITMASASSRHNCYLLRHNDAILK